MFVAVPSTRRALKQTTLDSLRGVDHEVTVVVNDSDRDAYTSAGIKNLLVLPPEIRGIGQVRHYILEEAKRRHEDRVLMLDDDLVFARRRADDPTKFVPASVDDLKAMLNDANYQMNKYFHIGIGAREGGNRRPNSYYENTRMLRALGYRTDILNMDFSFRDMPVMEDFYVALSLLTRGHAGCLINWIVNNQNGSNLPGGCSTYRTPEVQATAATLLAQKFPQFVNAVMKKGWQGAAERMDVIIQWKAAYEFGLAKRT